MNKTRYPMIFGKISFPYVQLLCVFVCMGMLSGLMAQPTFMPNEDPKPFGKAWELIDNISDEFNDSTLNETKWENTNPQRWRGRAPGIFKPDVVSMADGNMRVTCRMLASPEVVNGDTFTHAGGNLYSRFAGQVGNYFECRMKANKTFMSSTFWLINTRNEGTGCDVRTTELDIQECVGQVVTSANWAQSFDESMHSNTHSRSTTCQATPTGSAGGNAPTATKVWADYHVYGAWWKSPTEIEFYLDGEKAYTVTPKADFSLPMYLRLVTETYDWNPVPTDGGMTGSMDERTTFYDWVRSYRLIDDLSASNTDMDDVLFSIYPNPAVNDFVTVSFSNMIGKAQVHLLDIQGRMLRSQEVSAGKADFSLVGLSKGVYMIGVETSKGMQYRRFVNQ